MTYHEKMTALHAMREEAAWQPLFQKFPLGATSVDEANHMLAIIVATFRKALTELGFDVTLKLDIAKLKDGKRYKDGSMHKIENLVVFGGSKTIIVQVKVRAAYTSLKKTAFYLGEKSGVLALINGVLDQALRRII